MHPSLKLLLIIHEFIFAGTTHLMIILLYLPYYIINYCSFNLYALIYWVTMILLLYYINVSICMSICLHRYFSHSAFKTSRFGTFIISIIGSLANQKGVLWWSSKHIRHHKYCDQPNDPHSVTQTSFMYAWIIWLYYEYNVDWEYIPKIYKKPEIIFINYFHSIPKLLYCYFIYTLFPNMCFEAILFYYIIPSTLSALSVLTFNVKFHPNNTMNASRICKAIDMVTAYHPIIIGEAFHDDHHNYPQKARRPSLDLPYYLILAPLSLLGVIYDLK